jgi:ornithine cyclodeaminase/alanine dehydrogenase-like protein (mu-crystallin family)
MPIRILSHDDVHRCLPPKACIDAMEQALAALARGESSFPLRSVFRADGSSGFLGLMPGHRGGEQPLYALKAVCIFPENPVKHGIDAHQGGVLLFDGETGELTAVVDGAALTAIRTAAVTAVATRALARPGSSDLAVLGAGSQARAHIAALADVLPLSRVRVASRTFAHAKALADELAPHRAFPIEAVELVGDAVRGADVVVTVSTAREPILGADELEPGMHVNLIGSSIASTREITGAGLARTSLFVDRRESTVNESGDYLMALREGAIDEGHIRAEIGEVLEGMAPGRTSPDEITCFKGLGLAIEDLAAAELAIASAASSGIGTVAPW